MDAMEAIDAIDVDCPSGDGQLFARDAARRHDPTFTGMPYELLVAILSALCDNCGCEGTVLGGSRLEMYIATQSHLAALSSVSKTCRAMRLLAQPLLHRSFPAALYNARAGSFRFYQFVRTIATRPDLADSVRFLAFDTLVSHLVSCAPRTVSQILPNEREMDTIAQRAGQLGLSPPEDWANAMIVNTWPTPAAESGFLEIDEQTAVFVAQLAIGLCDKVQMIEFTLIRGRCHKYMFHRIMNPFYASRNINDIHRLSVGSDCGKIPEHWNSIHGLDIRQLDGLGQRMPKLREVEVLFGFLPDPTPSPTVPSAHLFADDVPVEFRPSWAVDLGVLVRLDLVHCSVSEAGLAGLLDNCANLQVFSCISVFNGAHLNYVFGAPLFPDGVSSVLSRSGRLRTTLRRLTLEHQPMHQSHGNARTYTSLQGLETVTEVHLGAMGLFSTLLDNRFFAIAPGSAPPVPPQPLSSILPPNIASLNIFQVGPWKRRASDAISKLLMAIRMEGRFRDLRRIRVWTHQFWPSLHGYPKTIGVEEWDPTLADDAAALGIEFVIDGPADETIQRLRLIA